MVKDFRDNELLTFIESSKDLFEPNELEEVEHYFNHGEYEMAFEGLVIEFIRIGRYPDKFSFTEWKDLALYYNSDKESVFDDKSWTNFMAWGLAYQRK
jgi:hypothetical protein